MYNKNKTSPHPFIIIIVISTPPTGGGDAAPMGWVIRGWPFPNDGSKFWRNRPSGCQVMGAALVAGGGGRFIFMLRSATSHFSLLGHLKWQAEKRRTASNIQLFYHFDLRFATCHFLLLESTFEPPLRSILTALPFFSLFLDLSLNHTFFLPQAFQPPSHFLCFFLYILVHTNSHSK